MFIYSTVPFKFFLLLQLELIAPLVAKLLANFGARSKLQLQASDPYFSSWDKVAEILQEMKHSQ